MNSRLPGARQAVSAVTLLGTRIPLATPNGVAHLKLPTGSAFTVVPPAGADIVPGDRHVLDSYSGSHLVMLAADQTTAADFEPDLVKWAVERSDIVVLWGSDAYAATIAEMERRIAGARRILLIMADCEAEQGWFDEVNRRVRRATPVVRLLCDPLNESGTVRDAGIMPRPQVSLAKHDGQSA